MVRQLVSALCFLIAANVAAVAQVNPVYRQDPVTGNATQQQQITIPSGFGITCQPGSNCPAPAGTVIGAGPVTNGDLPSYSDTTGQNIHDSGKAPPAGTILGTTDTQSVSNKTLDATNNLSAITTNVFGTSCATGGSCTQSSAGNAIASNVALSNTGTFFDGPSAAQGTSGNWFACGTVTLEDTAGAALFKAKLWDGTTVISSSAVNSGGAAGIATLTLCGTTPSAPAGNLRISVEDTTSASGLILANASGAGKDSKITALRISP